MRKDSFLYLKELAEKTIKDCTFVKKAGFFGNESNLIPDQLLKRYIQIIAAHGQNTSETLFLKTD